MVRVYRCDYSKKKQVKEVMVLGRKESDCVEVYALSGMDKALAYGVPEEMRGEVEIGCLVQVPLLRRKILGVVSKFGTEQKIPKGKLRDIDELIYPEPLMTEDLLKLAKWIQMYYASSPESVFEAMIPAAVRKQVNEKYIVYLRILKELTKEELKSLVKRAPRQASVYQYLFTNRGEKILKKQVLDSLRLGASSVAGLVEKGVVEELLGKSFRGVNLPGTEDSEKHLKLPQLNQEQEKAASDIGVSLEKRKFAVHLLHGVTGSGKTEVFLSAIVRVLERGGSVIYLVPEVALTPQTVGRIRSRLDSTGIKTVVWHSQLSAGERLDAWMSIVRGEAHVVVGARSAIFAPLKNLELIVVDEEHEPAYKQGETPRYNGRDVAVYRAMLSKAVCVLGSATPSLESLYNVAQGKYKLNRIEKRVDDRRMPTIHVVDLKPEYLKEKGQVNLSQVLVGKIHDCLEAKEQAILFINRRGYSSKMLCPECEYLAECPHCSVTLTYHRPERELRCHICDHRKRAPRVCPKCHSSKIHWKGYGTQRIEDVVGKVFPKAKVARMDADTMNRKDQFRLVLDKFRAGEIDILIGTQMIAKGLDFPNVTLVGLIDADISMHIQDFRAAERTFQLVVQVAGRSGRGEKPGEVVIQTFTPQANPIKYAVQSDFDGFLDLELKQRQEFHYPPYRHLIRHVLRGRNPEKVAHFAQQWVDFLEKHLSSPIEIRGPAEAPLQKVKDYYRYHIWFFVPSIGSRLPEIIEIRKRFKMDKDIIDIFDSDPVDMI